MAEMLKVRPRSIVRYQAPSLFPDAPSKPDAMRAYVQTVLVQLARAGKICVTDILNQPAQLRDMAGRVIRGEFILPLEDHRQVFRPEDIPQELVDYRIKLRAIGNHQIRWKKGMEPQEVRVWAYTGARTSAEGRVPIYEDVEYFIDAPEAEIPLMFAYLALKQYGKDCLRCKNETLRAKHWRFEEVYEDHEPMEAPPIIEPAKPRRGRPQRSVQGA